MGTVWTIWIKTRLSVQAAMKTNGRNGISFQHFIPGYYNFTKFHKNWIRNIKKFY